MIKFTSILVLIGGVALLAGGCDKAKDSEEAPSAAASPVQGEDEATKPAEPAAADPAAATTAEPKPAVAEAPATKCGAEPCPCKEGSKNKEGDDWEICELNADTKIQGYSCAAGRVVFHADGKLQECMLTADAEVDGHPCRGKPVSVKLHPNGKLDSCSASKAIELHGYPIGAYAGINLHDDGTIREGFLKDGTKEIDGYQCTKGIRLFKGGKLRMCTLAADAEITGEKVAKGTQVVFHEDGSIRGMWSDRPIKFAGKKYDQKDRGNWLCFEGGKPDPKGFGCNTF